MASKLVLAVCIATAATAAAGAEPPSDPFRSGGALCGGAPRIDPAAERAAEEAVPDPPVPEEIDEAAGTDLVTISWLDVPVDPVSPEIPIRVKDGVVGLTIRAEIPGWGDAVSVELLDPEGRLIACHDCPPDAPAVGEISPGRGTTQMPSTDRPGWELLPGTYSFRVRAIPEEGDARSAGAGPPTARVFATLRTNAAAEVEHLLDVNFVYLPNCGLTPAIADTSFYFQQFLERIDVWMQPTGIRLGNVTHVALDRPELSIVGSWREAGRMFRTSAEVGRPRALNVYCYASTAGELYLAAGFSGAIPGPAANGLRDSGIAIRTPPFLNCVPPDEQGYSCLDAYASLFAHEVGHYLGFYHTTEGDLQHEDPFSDTPRCPLDNQNLRDCPDYDYVMFPLIHLTNEIWGGQQTIIAKTHPIVRTVAVVHPRPETAALEPSPNPFRESVSIRPAAGHRAGIDGAAVYDVSGRRVRELAPAGASVTWDGRDDSGRTLPAGVYFVRAHRDGRRENVRVVKLR
jgi:hypothetical protein